MATIINGEILDDGCDPTPEDVIRDQQCEELAEQCTCPGIDRPCEGLLAGGMCDDLHLEGGGEDED